jgi:glycosyltransferase involved in cell wall biosynthesis
MRCPQLKDLPMPPAHKTGWPWTEESSQLPDLMPHGRPWPRISIVTPSYNQGQSVEETIRSVLLQGYPNVEYIVIDGASNDGSPEMIAKYGRWLAHWISESDRGQSHAINKGFGHASGEVMAWINSDDVYTPGALHEVGSAVEDVRGTGTNWNGWLIGRTLYWNLITNEKKELSPDNPPDDKLDLLRWRCPQRSSFWSRTCWSHAGPLREDFHFIFDTEFFLKLVFLGYKPDLLEKVLAVGHLHENCKTFAQAECWGSEGLMMYDRLADFLSPPDRRRVRQAVRADLARVRYHQARTDGRWLSAVLAAMKILRYSPPWRKQEGLPS